jgi:S-formylglutathione hydrolase FrmB
VARIELDFFSDTLEVSTSVSVVWPQVTEHQIGVGGGRPSGGGVPLLYLLHGLSDDHTAWSRYTSIERYAVERGLAVVMPAVHHSFYADELHGHPYWTFLTEELPEVIASTFHVSRRREDTFVAGLSMGGYGAVKWALNEPGRFAGVASLSGGLDVTELATRPERQALFDRVFGGVPRPDDDLLALVARADTAALPPLFVTCGTEDHVFPGNERFVAAAREAGIDLTVDFRPGGHEWAFWDAGIQRVLDWLPLRPGPARP